MADNLWKRRDVLSASTVGVGSTIFGVNVVEAKEKEKQEIESGKSRYLNLELESADTPEDALISVECGQDLPPVTHHNNRVYITYPGEFQISQYDNMTSTWNGIQCFNDKKEESLPSILNFGSVGHRTEITGSSSPDPIIEEAGDSFQIEYNNQSILVESNSQKTMTTNTTTEYVNKSGEIKEATIKVNLRAENKGYKEIVQHPTKILLANNKTFVNYIESLSELQANQNLPNSVRKPSEVQLDTSIDAYILGQENGGE